MEMDLETEMSVFSEELFMARLEEQCLHPNLSSGTPSEKADLIRNVLVHQFHARAQGIISDTALKKVQDQYWDMYSKVVDNFDVKEGLNNYAEGALALCNLGRNESQAWKSSLSLKTFLSSSAGGRFRKSCQVSANTESCDTPNQVVKIRTDVKLPERGVMSTEQKQTQGQNGVSIRGQRMSEQTTDIPGSNQVFTSKVQNPFYKQMTNKTQDSGHQMPSKLNSLPGRKQNSFSFKKGLNCAENTLPYDLPPGWDDPSLAEPSVQRQPPSGIEPNYNRPRYHGDQEVPRKPLFASGGGPTSALRGRSYGSHQPAQTPPSFYRRAEVGRENPDPFKQEADEEEDSAVGPFRTAKEQLSINQQKKYGQNRGPVKPASYGNVKKSLGTRRGPGSKFVPPVVGREETGDSNLILRKAGPNKACPGGEEPVDERLKGLEPKMIELIMNEIMDHGAPVAWDDIAGLDFAKKTIKEIVVWPMLRPDIFTGLRGPPKGLLLFGPPGTGKTLIGKCIASQSKSTFFSISASSLTSKWVGEGEKMVKALFSVSRCHQPAVIFIDEIDSLLSQRTDGEHEASRRIKTEFLVQLDGATTDSDERLLVIGATNRPQEIDEAARRRFVKRLYIPLPEKLARQQIILNLLSSQRYQLSEQELNVICEKTEGYSGSDMANLCREAALGPIRSISFTEIEQITAEQVRPITFEDFVEAIRQVRASVSTKDLDLYIDWNKLYGCGGK